jgi:hypothetical protein
MKAAHVVSQTLSIGDKIAIERGRDTAATSTTR